MPPPSALAGHAGEMGAPVLMPHELMGGLVVLAGLGLILLGLQGLTLWRLRRLERRLHHLERITAENRPDPTTKP